MNKFSVLTWTLAILLYPFSALAASDTSALSFSLAEVLTMSVADLGLTASGKQYTGTLSLVFASNSSSGYVISIQGTNGNLKHASVSGHTVNYSMVCGTHSSGGSTIAGATLSGSTTKQQVSKNASPTAKTSATISCAVTTADTSTNFSGNYAETLTIYIEAN